MAVIGSFGRLIFEVSEKKTQTFNNFTRTVSPRYVEHNIIGQKPKLEFVGPGADPVSFDVKFRAELGINPEKQVAELREYANTGRKDLFIRGNSPISSNYWVIEEMTETHKRIDNLGNVLEIHASIELREYVKEEEMPKKTVSIVNPIPLTSSKPVKGKMTITVKSVHIRSGPGVNNKVLGYAMRGDELTVYGERNGWYDLGGGKYITANSAYSSFKGVS